MTAEQAKKLSLIFRQVRDVVKNSIDDLADIAENALSVFVESETISRKELLPMTSESRLLNKTELAKRLGISVRKVSDLQTEGLPTVKLGKRVLFDYEDVLIWAKDKKIKSRRKNKLRVVK